MDERWEVDCSRQTLRPSIESLFLNSALLGSENFRCNESLLCKREHWGLAMHRRSAPYSPIISMTMLLRAKRSNRFEGRLYGIPPRSFPDKPDRRDRPTSSDIFPSPPPRMFSPVLLLLSLIAVNADGMRKLPRQSATGPLFVPVQCFPSDNSCIGLPVNATACCEALNRFICSNEYQWVVV
jgi:hypothetical protein